MTNLSNPKLINCTALAGCIILVITQMFWKAFDSETFGIWAYFLGDAIFKVVIIWAFSRAIRIASFKWFLVFDFFFNLAVGNLIDEVLFDPELVEINEYVCFVATAIIFIFRWLSHATKIKPLTLLKTIFGYGTFGTTRTKD